MDWIDQKYISILGTRLDRFHKTGKSYNFRCPLCGDSQKNKHKARGYVFRKKNDLFFRCHNCSSGMTAGNLVKYVDSNLHREYVLERYKGGEGGHSNYKAPAKMPEFLLPKFKMKLELDSIQILPDEHYAKQYLVNRKIPKEFFSSLYYAPDFKKFIDGLMPDHDKTLKDNDPRIVIPFYDVNKNLIAVQGRALAADSTLRYITIKVNENHPKIFGLERFDKKKKGYVLEGPFDSMFIPNSLAAAGSNLTDLGKFVDINSTVVIHDNQPRNGEIVRVIGFTIDSGFSVCIWPDKMDLKDINEMILDGMLNSEILHIIDRNTYSGIEAKFRLQAWKKC